MPVLDRSNPAFIDFGALATALGSYLDKLNGSQGTATGVKPLSLASSGTAPQPAAGVNYQLPTDLTSALFPLNIPAPVSEPKSIVPKTEPKVTGGGSARVEASSSIPNIPMPGAPSSTTFEQVLQMARQLGQMSRPVNLDEYMSRPAANPMMENLGITDPFQLMGLSSEQVLNIANARADNAYKKMLTEKSMADLAAQMSGTKDTVDTAQSLLPGMLSNEAAMNREVYSQKMQDRRERMKVAAELKKSETKDLDPIKQWEALVNSIMLKYVEDPSSLTPQQKQIVNTRLKSEMSVTEALEIKKLARMSRAVKPGSPLYDPEIIAREPQADAVLATAAASQPATVSTGAGISVGKRAKDAQGALIEWDGSKWVPLSIMNQ